MREKPFRCITRKNDTKYQHEELRYVLNAFSNRDAIVWTTVKMQFNLVPSREWE